MQCFVVKRTITMDEDEIPLEFGGVKTNTKRNNPQRNHLTNQASTRRKQNRNQDSTVNRNNIVLSNNLPLCTVMP
jgi:hypothetical protein